MSEQSASVELVRHEAAAELGRPLPPMDDGEVAALWRQAKALADSGLFKGAKQGETLKAGQAFAKMLAGRDLGLTPFEAMQQLHVLPDGKLEASSDLHAAKVRGREGYDFDVWWIKSRTGRAYTPAADGSIEVPEGEREAVRAADEDPTDLRPTVGCAIVFTVDGQSRGVSTWTVEDTQRASLHADRGGRTSLHVKYPRSMYFARAMTNGVAWYVPEVMGGVRVYGLGEVPRGGESGEDLAAGSGEAPAMDSLPTEVEAVLARARELGHAGLASRESAVMALRGRPSEDVGRWIATATKVLNAHARGAEPPAVEPEPPEAEVVPDAPAQNEAVSEPEGAEGPTGTGEVAAAQETPPEPHEAQESAEVVDGEAVAERVEVLDARASALRARVREAEEDDPAGDEASELRAELDAVEAERAAAADPGQGSFGV